MSKKLSPFAFIIILVLLVTSILPSQAAASGNLSLLWEKEFNGHFYNETAKTSQNGTLMSTYEVSWDSNSNRVYTYDFMKLDAAGSMVETRELKNGQTKIFEYDGHGYVAFMNNATQMYELYDENFELVNSKSVPFKADDSFKFTVKDGVIALTTGHFEYGDLQAVFYSLKTFEEIDPSQIPIERYAGISNHNDEWKLESYSIVGVTFADTVVTEIPLNFSQFKNGQPDWGTDSVGELNGYFYAAFTMDIVKEYSDSPDIIELLKIDLQGNIVDSLTVTDNDIYIDNYSTVMLDDKIVFTGDQVSAYDFASFSLIKSHTTPRRYSEIGKLPNNYYYYQAGNALAFADSNGDIQYEISDLEYVLTASDKYFVGRYDWDRALFSVATGEKILEDQGFEFGLHDDRVVAYDGKYTSSSAWKSVVKLYGEKSNEPVGETYLPNKKWTITFSNDVDESSVTKESIYVLDENGKKVEDLSFKTIGDKVEVNAPAAGYDAGKTYTLHITSAVQSAKGISLKEERSKVFTIK